MSYEAYESSALPSYGEGSTDWDALIDKLGSKDGRVRRKARVAIEELGHKAVPELCRVLLEGNRFARWEAARALKDLHDPSSAPCLVEALDDDLGICWLASDALTGLGDAALPPLLEALAAERDPVHLYKAAHHVLAGLRGSAVGLPLPVASVLYALEDIAPSLEVPIAAWQALQELEAESHAVTTGGGAQQDT